MKEKRWKPKKGERFWFITSQFAAIDDKWYNLENDFRYFYKGNCFKTKEEAEAAAEKVKALLLSLHDNEQDLKDNEEISKQKLTADVFNRPDCPEWAEYAAVDKCRNAMWYEGEPEVVGSVFWNSQRGQIKKIPGKFDASDWQNSLIERPKNRVNWDEVEEICCNSKLTFKEKKQELPDWCKVGEWVYLCNGTYSRIVSINDCHVNLENGISVGKNSIHEEMVPARLRPYNAEEMKELVGKVVCDTDGNNELITGWSVDMRKVRFNSIYYSAQRLIDEKFTIDGSPCGVLEHLEEGEWVK